MNETHEIKLEKEDNENKLKLNKHKDEFRLDDLTRFLMYREMKELEPRIWTRDHHAITMPSICYPVNFTICGAHKFYNPSIVIFDSFLASNKIKILFFSPIQ